MCDLFCILSKFYINSFEPLLTNYQKVGQYEKQTTRFKFDLYHTLGTLQNYFQ